jgi:hypothetical protein
MGTIQKKSVFAESDHLFFEIGKRNIKNHFHVNKFGENSSVGTSFVTIWDGATIYSYLSTATKLKISSSSADDSYTGTGAQLLFIAGLNENWDYTTEIIQLNGQTVVETENTYIRIFRGVVLKAGSGVTAAGYIYAGTGTVTEGVPTNKYIKINIGNNQTQMAMLSIPRGYEGYIIHSTGSVGLEKEYHAAFFMQRFESNVWNKIADTILVASADARQIMIPTKFDEKTDLEMRGKIDSTPITTCTGTFEIVLVKIDESVPDID